MLNKPRIANFSRVIWNEFIYGGHLLSLGAASIVLTSAFLLRIKITWDCFIVVYLGIESAYLYNRYKEFEKDIVTNPERTKHIRGYINKIPIIIGIFVVTLGIILFYFSNLKVLLFGFFLVLMSFLYSKIFKGLTAKIVGFKNVFVSLMWASLVLFLVIYYSAPWNTPVLIVFLFVFLKAFITTNFFDIKDTKIDKKEHLLTLVVVWGKNKLLKFLYLLNILSALLLFFGVYLRFLPVYSLFLSLTFFCVLYYLKEIRNSKVAPYLYYAVADGEYVLWGVLILVGKILT